MARKLCDGYARVRQGMLKGRVLDNNVKVFHGIPYAQPPVGCMRWRYPEEAPAWGGVRPADRWGSVCLQGDISDQESLENFRSEDCLYLNVHTPAVTEDAALPVYIFIHGGGFMGGSSGHLYHGETLAQQGMVVVTINYRCNVFGFLSHPALAEDDPLRTTGNYGIVDMIFAIRWVYENIAAFGGDPERITIGGQSAGGSGVLAVISSPHIGNMVKGAWVESGVFRIRTGDVPDRAQANEMGKHIADELGAHTAQELRHLSSKELVEYAFSGKMDGMRMAPVVDGYWLTESVYDAFKNGHVTIPVVFGVNRREFIAGYKPTDKMSMEEFEKRMGMPREVSDAAYPSDTDAHRIASFCEMVSDSMLKRCHDLASVRPEGNSFIYYFDKDIPGENSDFYSAAHSCEMPYIFGRPGYGAANPWDMREWTHWDYDMMRAFQNYLRAFVESGRPDARYFPVWPAYTPESEAALIIGEEPYAMEHPRKAQLNILPE